MSQIIIKEKKKRVGLRPVIGLVLGAACLILGWFAAPSVVEWAQSQNRSFGRGMDETTLRLFFAVMIFLVLITIIGLIIGAATPKKAMNVKETDLTKERLQMMQSKEYEKKRQRKLNRQMREEVQARTDTNRERFDDRRS